jgi:Parvulin-like peptidyl-prolyl isomerase
VIIAIRRYLKGPAFKAILWLTLISVAGFWGLPSLFKSGSRGGTGGPTVATINGIEISGQEYNRVTNIQQEFLRRLKTQYGQYADLFIQAMGLNSDPKVLALDILIRDVLINEAADTLRINITPDYIESRLDNPEFIQKQLSQILPTYVFDEGGNINPAALNRYLSHERLSSEDLNGLVKEALSRELVLEFVGVASYVPQFVAQEQYMQDVAKKQYSVMALAFDPILKKEQANKLADDDVKKFFDTQNRASKMFWTPEKRKGTTWTFDAKKFGVAVDEKEVEAYYQDYRGQKFVSVPMKLEVRTIVFSGTEQDTYDKALKIRQELLSDPDSFASKAKELSEDKETAKNGGLVPFFSKGTHDKAFEKAAFLLKNDGDISEPVATSRGIEIVKRVAKKQAEFKPFENVKGEIKELLILEKFKEEFSEAVRSLIDQNMEAELKKFVETHGATQGSVSTVEGEASKAAKAIAGLREKGAMTSYYDNNMAVIVRLDDLHKREIPALETVRTQVEQALHKERAEKAFNKLVKETAAKSVDTPMSDIAKAIGGSVESIDWLNPSDKKALEVLKKKDLPVESLVRLDKVGSTVTQVGPKNAYIVRLDAIKPFDAKDYQENQKELLKKLEREYSMYFVEGFVASLYRNATIKTSEEMVNTAREDDYTPTEDYF